MMLVYTLTTNGQIVKNLYEMSKKKPESNTQENTNWQSDIWRKRERYLKRDHEMIFIENIC